eukprot:scaffold11078_cov103-Isochrysis_galbana.AAC.2
MAIWAIWVAGWSGSRGGEESIARSGADGMSAGRLGTWALRPHRSTRSGWPERRRSTHRGRRRTPSLQGRPCAAPAAGLSWARARPTARAAAGETAAVWAWSAAARSGQRRAVRPVCCAPPSPARAGASSGLPGSSSQS